MILLEANDIKHAIQDRLLFSAVHLKVGDRDRIGIVGLNGAGSRSWAKSKSRESNHRSGWPYRE